MNQSPTDWDDFYFVKSAQKIEGMRRSNERDHLTPWTGNDVNISLDRRDGDFHSFLNSPSIWKSAQHWQGNLLKTSQRHVAEQSAIYLRMNRFGRKDSQSVVFQMMAMCQQFLGGAARFFCLFKELSHFPYIHQMRKTFPLICVTAI